MLRLPSTVDKTEIVLTANAQQCIAFKSLEHRPFPLWLLRLALDWSFREPLSKFVSSEVMRMHDARKFSWSQKVESVAPKDGYEQHNRFQSLVFC
jgi:hypothetical protein